jgi:4-coumarate--CoA ligase
MKRGTVGQMIPNMLGKIVDGELLVKGPNIMKGYLRNSGADKATFTEDGWMKTGDLAWFDDDGDLFIVDRVKEVSVAVCFAGSSNFDADRMFSSSSIRDFRW